MIYYHFPSYMYPRGVISLLKIYRVHNEKSLSEELEWVC